MFNAEFGSVYSFKSMCKHSSRNRRGPMPGVIIYEHFKAVEVTEIITTINHTYTVIEATTRSGKVIKYAVDEAGNVFYDLNNLPK